MADETKGWDRNAMAARAAQELRDGMLGMGPFPFEGAEDPDLINAGKLTIPELQQAAYFDSATSFSMIRGGKIAMAILGAMKLADGVSEAALRTYDLQPLQRNPLARLRKALARIVTSMPTPTKFAPEALQSEI